MIPRLRCLLVLSLVVFASFNLVAQTISASIVPTTIAAGGGPGTTGSPYALFVQISGWTNGAGKQAYVKLYNGSYGNEYMWSGSAFSDLTTYSSSYQPVVTVDASGNWSGWIVAKHNDATLTAAKLRAAVEGATSTYLTSLALSWSIDTLSSTGNAGWIKRDSSSRSNEGIVAYGGGKALGVYLSEDNSVTEGYSYSSGGFKISVPVGTIDSLVAYTQAGARDTAFVGPWTVRAGQETDASVVESRAGTAKGTGTATIAPTALEAGISSTLTLRVAGSTTGTITAVAVAMPAKVSWSQTVADVQVTASTTPATSVSGDTLYVSGLSLGATDTASIALSNVTGADTTMTATFPVLTGSSLDSLGLIVLSPQLVLYGTPQAISRAKESDSTGVPLKLGTWVSFQGIVTVANEFGGPAHVQDSTAGVAVYGSAVSGNVTIGDEVIVAGLVTQYYGLTGISSPILVKKVGTGNTVTPLVATAAEIAGDGADGVERYEGRLVRLDGVTVSGSGTWAYQNYTLTDASGTTELRIDNSTALIGVTMPVGAFDVIGVVGQYTSTSSGGYQVMPRLTADVITSGPIIESLPVQDSILPTGFSMNWTTYSNGTSKLRYGATTSLELGVAGNDSLQAKHAVTLSGLTAATIYYVQAFSSSGSDTSTAPVMIVSTASPTACSGTINVYFNHSADTSLAWYHAAHASQNLTALLVARIANAKRSVDAAFYSLSGTPGTAVSSALIAARARGVSVRVIGETDNDGGSGFTALQSNSIPFITDTYDATNAGAGYMHNKFAVIDGRGGAAESVWVWTGSWNPTYNGTNLDYQNAIELQDVALAQAYTLEFNEMWGSSTETANASVSKFGADKTDNTPHRFVIGGKKVECYFSPSDGTTAKIVAAIDSASHSIAVGTMTITRSDIAAALVAKKAAGKTVRCILDENTDTGSQYSTLVSGGITPLLNTSTNSAIFHHKYAVIDGEDPTWSAAVITGSHNWSSAAETKNNENTLIVHDGDIANQYLQEFAARYYEFGGTDSLTVGIDAEEGMPTVYSLSQNYPNPFNPTTTIRFALPKASTVTLKVYNLLGQEVASLAEGTIVAGYHTVAFDAHAFASGMYFCRITAGKYTAVKKMLLVK